MLNFQNSAASALEWKTSPSPVPYEEAVSAMESRADAIVQGIAGELVWLLEHPPLYTAGTSAKADDLLTPARFPVHQTGRGGQFTYHGPGQRIAYTMLNLKARYGGTPDLRDYVKRLEAWIIATLAEFGIEGSLREGRIGVWVDHPAKGEAKIAALGIRVRRGVSYHGIAINVNPELEHFSGIVPCGIREFGITSLMDMGKNISISEMDSALKQKFHLIFG